MGAYEERKKGEKKSNLLRIGGLWKLKSGKGLSGSIDDRSLDAIASALNDGGGKANILLLPNSFKGGKNPQYILFAAPYQKKGDSTVKRPETTETAGDDLEGLIG